MNDNKPIQLGAEVKALKELISYLHAFYMKDEANVFMASDTKQRAAICQKLAESKLIELPDTNYQNALEVISAAGVVLDMDAVRSARIAYKGAQKARLDHRNALRGFRHKARKANRR
jgi:hypothetical protein